MKIKDRLEYLSKPAVYTAGKQDIVFDVIRVMADRNIGSAVVVNDRQEVLGMLTERDVLRRLVSAERDPKTTRVEEIMTENPRVAREDDDVVQWLRVMSNERFRRLPVVDVEGKLLNIMTQGDFVSYTWPELLRVLTDKVEEAAGRNNQHVFIGMGVLVYSIAMILIFQLT